MKDNKEEQNLTTNEMELNPEEMNKVAGGGLFDPDPVDPATCKHKRVKQIRKYSLTDGKNDWGKHISIAYYIYKCEDCGKRWESPDPDFRKNGGCV